MPYHNWTPALPTGPGQGFGIKGNARAAAMAARAIRGYSCGPVAASVAVAILGMLHCASAANIVQTMVTSSGFRDIQSLSGVNPLPKTTILSLHSVRPQRCHLLLLPPARMISNYLPTMSFAQTLPTLYMYLAAVP